MKKLFCFVGALLMIQFVFLNKAIAQDDVAKGPVLKFEKEREDLGNMYIDELKQTSIDIKFTNEGDQPLVLSQVRGCCGTRIVDWPRTPILPGDEGEISISFRLAPRAHKVSRTVTVLSNAPGGSSVYRIVGQVFDRSQQQFDTKSYAMAPSSDKSN